MKILVREKELACRNSWGDDLWVDAATDASKPGVVSPPRKGLFYVSNRVDDEVTSVIDTTSMEASKPAGQRPAAGADDVVTHTTVRHDDPTTPRTPKRPKADDLNAPANADQAERVRLMARGNRDAIQKARERHTERRKPVRESSAPDGSDAHSDRILAAQDREQYVHITKDAERSSVDAYRDTPPVPREEVEAKGAGLSPASGSDERFDTVAELKPEVDLAQLRGFLNRAGTSHRGASGSGSGDATIVTSYDLVLKRAQEIKAASDVEFAHRRTPPNIDGGAEATPDPPAPGSPEPLPAHANRNELSKPKRRLRGHLEQAPQSHAAAETMRPNDPDRPLSLRRQPNVVWDVEGDRLSIVFERARMAIGQQANSSTASLSIAHLSDNQPFATDSYHVSDEPTAGWTEDPDRDDAPDSYFGDDYGSEGLAADMAYCADDEQLDDGYEPGDYEHDAASSPAESPRGSWWRSLNFGLRRRYRPGPGDAYPYVYDDVLATEDPYAESSDDLEWGEPIRHDGARVYAASNAEHVGTTHDHDEVIRDDEPIVATSPESWMQDAREFPEPQPAEWHETRTRLLTQAPDPLAGESGPVSMSSPRSSLHAYTARTDEENAFPGEQHGESVAVQSVSPSFALDQASGMDAFRAALFGDHRQAPTEDGFARQTIMSPTAAAETPQRQTPPRSLTAKPKSYVDDRHAVRAPDGVTRMAVQQRSERATRRSTVPQIDRAFDSDFDIRDAIEDQDAGHERHFEVASRVPKSCSTCRSFRPSDNGERGWCMNDYSTTHRQMVNSDDLACRSSIGDWWLAADTSWIPPTDVIAPKTPRTDRLIARSAPREAVASNRGRRVRTSKVS